MWGQCSGSNNILGPDMFTTGYVTGLDSSLFVSGITDGYNCNIAIDTGRDISIVHPDLLNNGKDRVSNQ